MVKFKPQERTVSVIASNPDTGTSPGTPKGSSEAFTTQAVTHVDPNQIKLRQSILNMVGQKSQKSHSALNSRMSIASNYRFSRGTPGNSLPSLTTKSVDFDSPYKPYSCRLPHDNFQRVFFNSHYRVQNSRGPSREPTDLGYKGSEGQLLFGETDYLKRKLGLTMPRVEDTLKDVTLRNDYKRKHGLGLKQLSKQRLGVISKLLIGHYPDSGKNNRLIPKISNNVNLEATSSILAPKKTLSCRKGRSESAQYLALLYAQERRARYQEELTKFALARQVCNLQSKRNFLDSACNKDDETLLQAKKAIEGDTKGRIQKRAEKERRRLRRLSLIETETASSTVESESIDLPSPIGEHPKSLDTSHLAVEPGRVEESSESSLEQ